MTDTERCWPQEIILSYLTNLQGLIPDVQDEDGIQERRVYVPLSTLEKEKENLRTFRLGVDEEIRSVQEALEKEKAEREAGRKELQRTIRRMDEATIGALEAAGAWEGGVVKSIGLLAERADAAEKKLEEFISRVESDRREPDKLLCHIASARSPVTRHEPNREEQR